MRARLNLQRGSLGEPFIKTITGAIRINCCNFVSKVSYFSSSSGTAASAWSNSLIVWKANAESAPSKVRQIESLPNKNTNVGTALTLYFSNNDDSQFSASIFVHFFIFTKRPDFSTSFIISTICTPAGSHDA